MKSRKKNSTKSQSKKTDGTSYRVTVSSPKYSQGKKQVKEGMSRMPVFNEQNQSYSISSRMRAIGNSKGVILPNRVIEEAGISFDADLIIQVSDGVILIAEDRSKSKVNTDLSTWDKQFKNAIKNGNKPGPIEWGGIQNRFDEEEWT